MHWDCCPNTRQHLPRLLLVVENYACSGPCVHACAVVRCGKSCDQCCCLFVIVCHASATAAVQVHMRHATSYEAVNERLCPRDSDRPVAVPFGCAVVCTHEQLSQWQHHC